MSAHDVMVHDANSTTPIKIADVPIGSEFVVTISGKTTITEVSPAGSYRIYSLQGDNVAAGVLTDALTLDGQGGFTFSTTFWVTAALFDSADSAMFEFGVDVFQQSSGSDEGMCVEVASAPYVAYEAAKPAPPFEFLCSDAGDGQFRLLPTPVDMQSKDVPAPSCSPPPPPASAALDWYYCPRDPGCVTYSMSVSDIVFETSDAKGAKAGDAVTLHINGTTSITKIPDSGSYRIYSLSGKNAASGVLTDAFKITATGFEASIPVTLTEDMFSGDYFEMALDVFQEKSGSDEGMCVEISNPSYVAYLKAIPSPPFNMFCTDSGGGHFVSKLPGGVPEKVSSVTVASP